MTIVTERERGSENVTVDRQEYIQNLLKGAADPAKLRDFAIILQ